MSKWIQYSLAAAGTAALAVLAYSTGRVLVPLGLAASSICFVIAAVGAARGKGVRPG